MVAVDPGSEKCGVAVVHKQKGILYKAVVPTPELAGTVERLIAEHQLNRVIVGDRTSSRSARKRLAEITVNGNKPDILAVDEHRSSDAARKRYWQEHPPRGWKRLIPVTMQVPPVPVDDYVAVILAERFLGM
ncbi:hypothetical protein P22_0584 [Propionispora sp. 2/2-37]|nr:hypothetical protein P22_0584 [Propionispora sp. 2/2-37]